MVPLFLNTISSGLLTDIRGTEGHPPDPIKVLVLAGFCLVAAVSSRAFISNLSDKILRAARNAEEKSEEAVEKSKEAVERATEARAIAAPLVEEEAPESIESVAYAYNFTDSTPKIDLNKEERSVLLAMTGSRYTMRSLSGLKEETGLPKPSLSAVISSLMEKGLVGEAVTSRGNTRWFATSTGQSAASAEVTDKDK